MLIAIVIGAWLAFLWIAALDGQRKKDNYRATWMAALIFAGSLSALLPFLMLALGSQSDTQTRTSGPTAPLGWIGTTFDTVEVLMIGIVVRILLSLSLSGVFLLIYLLIWGRPGRSR